MGKSNIKTAPDDLKENESLYFFVNEKVMLKMTNTVSFL